ncbi:hypothetical protein OG417_07800 [Actinoallomurus sp. NBC_01490]|uniref:hypothetical protein n=1 Tax=Actinoallomurus sp. NBC_01490 TaxID=2903557 RepID=UPI002E3566F5|nr:hypothetical protein [Actinoallomurus sp. NBC_01490]
MNHHGISAGPGSLCPFDLRREENEGGPNGGPWRAEFKLLSRLCHTLEDAGVERGSLCTRLALVSFGPTPLAFTVDASRQYYMLHEAKRSRPIIEAEGIARLGAQYLGIIPPEEVEA